MTLVFATNNEHKLREARQILGNECTVLSLSDIGCHEDIPETCDTFEGNALQKARYVADRYGCDCFADDTGLEVTALGGEPGVKSARYAVEAGAGSDHDSRANMRLLLSRLEGVGDRRAQFRTAIAMVRGGRVTTVEGIVRGSITRKPSGADGFGYDPVFIPEGSVLTFAEMKADEKNAISHRGRALRALLEAIRGDAPSNQ